MEHLVWEALTPNPTSKFSTYEMSVSVQLWVLGSACLLKALAPSVTVVLLYSRFSKLLPQILRHCPIDGSKVLSIPGPPL